MPSQVRRATTRAIRALLDTTLEIVEEEVGTLRRLVGNFSSFARLPHAELKEAEPARLPARVLGAARPPGGRADSSESGGVAMIQSCTHDVEVRWEVPRTPMPAAIDRQMLRRVLVNLVRNAVEAIREARRGDGEGAGESASACAAGRGRRRRRSSRTTGRASPKAARERVFDPYFTTKAEGTGLGLAIVKKIVVEHNGTIAVAASERLGGASFVVRLPAPRSLEAMAAERGPVSVRA